MTYKNIVTANKKSLYNITFQQVINCRFYHVKKGYSNLKLRNFSVVDIANILGGRKQNEILRGLNNCIVNKIQFWAFDRIVIDKKGNWHYIAGQDYISELRDIRKFLYNLS